VERIRNQINNGAQVNMWQVESPFVVCDLLKLYLRQLPDPLLTYELYDCFLAKAKSFIRLGHKMDLSGTICLLPSANQAMLKRLIHCLKNVQEHAAENKMNGSNLGLIFGPSLLRAPESADTGSQSNLMEEYKYINAIALSFIEDYDMLFRDVAYKPMYILYAKVVQSYLPEDSEHLRLTEGDIVLVMEKKNTGFWYGELHAKRGYFPVSHCTYINGDACIE